jgi:hypothetical protein
MFSGEDQYILFILCGKASKGTHGCKLYFDSCIASACNDSFMSFCALKLYSAFMLLLV